ncbi:MAG: formylmethanofuran dehydrogenase subunit A [Acidobacteria bacterium]|nr:formylmethanofuran dehydrogenase subunit A [Acidobacteriota bacterium]
MLRIRNGRIVDPANGRRGEVGDICVGDGKVVDSLPASAPVVQARGLVVMPGAIDLHTHVAGPAVGAARLLCPEDGGRNLPTLSETGRLYARMGYTTIMEAAVAPVAARSAHADLDAIPIVDKGLYILMGNNAIALGFIRDARLDGLREYVAWLLDATRGFAVKAANPGGVEGWKCGAVGSGGAPGPKATALAHGPGLDDEVAGVTPRRIMAALASAISGLGLPHPLHLHMNGLGLPGNAALSLQTMEALKQSPVHFTHLQFHSYGGRTPKGLRSRAADLAGWINSHPAATVDVGQVVFGPAVTISADAPAQYRLHRATGRKWFNLDLEAETGCGIVPHVYRESHLVSAVQWAIGLEIFLLVDDPWRVFLSTDHPNGGAFTNYPAIIRLLMDRRFRAGVLARVHAGARDRTILAGIDREYTLDEIAIVTRAGPARALGLANKGHLGPGADADIVLYNPSDDIEAMFAMPVMVIKDGVVVGREGEIVEETRGRTLHAAPPRAAGRARDIFEKGIREEIEAYTTVAFEDYPVPEGALRRAEAVPARPRD